MNNLIINNNEEIRITSKDLCDVINIFRKEEGNEVVREHNDLMKSIRVELKALENAGIDGQGNFSQSSYVNKQGKIQPCFLMTEEAVMQMLNKESAVVRYKTQQYIKSLKNQKNSNELIEDYQSKYGLRRIRKTFTNTKDPRKTYEKFIELTKEEIKAKRLTTGDRIKALKIIIDTLEVKVADNISTMRGSELLAIQELLTDINKDLRVFCNKRNGSLLAAKTKEINQLNSYFPSDDDWYLIEKAAFSENYMYESRKDKKGFVKTPAYSRWINNLNLNQYLPETLDNVDFTKPLSIWIAYGCMDKFDIVNLHKAILDQISDYYGFDDKQVVEFHPILNEYVSSYSESYMFISIRNI